jgi:hypothetical protein
MKYVFRPFETGPTAGVSNNWGHPQNPQGCPQCETTNLKLAEKAPADKPVVASATPPPMGGNDFSASKGFPELPENPPTAAASPPAPEMMMANRRFDTFDEQKWLRRTWGLLLLLVLLAATGLLAFSLIQSPSATSDMVKNSTKGNINGMPMPASAVIADEKQEAHTPDGGRAAPATAPEPAKQSAGTSTDANMIAQPAAVANAQCSGARQALALCETH